MQYVLVDSNGKVANMVEAADQSAVAALPLPPGTPLEDATPQDLAAYEIAMRVYQADLVAIQATHYTPPPGLTLVPATAGAELWATYSNGVFTPAQ